MARPLKVQEKYTTEMLTISDINYDGSFKLVNNKGEEVGTGRARASKNHPGYVTLSMSRYTPALRVPIDWLDHTDARGVKPDDPDQLGGGTFGDWMNG